MIVGICDDEEYIIEFIKNVISNMEKTFDGTVEIVEYRDGKEILTDDEINKLDLLFLDIEMPYVDGIKVGDYIRNKVHNYDIQIVYVTGRSGYERKLFDYQPLHFLEKPVKPEDVEYCINKCNDLKHLHSRIFTCISNRREISVKIEDIVYFERTGKNVNIFMKDKESIPINKTIAQVAEELAMAMFIQINRYQVINTKYIQKMYRESVEMTDGNKFYISRERVHEVAIQFLNIMRKMNEGSF